MAVHPAIPPPLPPRATMASGGGGSSSRRKPHRDGVLFVKSFFRTFVFLQPYEISPDLNRRLEDHLKEKYEGLCSRFGFVKKGSLTLQRGGDGVIQRQFFNGNWRFDVVCHAQVARPTEGDKLWGTLMETTGAGWVVGVHDDSPERSVVLTASIPNGNMFEQQGGLPQVPRGTRVRFQVKKVSLIGREYVRVVGIKLEVGGVADADVAPPFSRVSSVPEEEVDLGGEAPLGDAAGIAIGDGGEYDDAEDGGAASDAGGSETNDSSSSDEEDLDGGGSDLGGGGGDDVGDDDSDLAGGDDAPVEVGY